MFKSVDKTKNENISLNILDPRTIKDEMMDEHAVIKIRTPHQVNSSYEIEGRQVMPPAVMRANTMPPRRHSVHPGAPVPQFISNNNKVVVKRLGNTTISARNGFPMTMKQSPVNVVKDMITGNLVTVTQPSPPKNSPPTDPRDHLIVQLQEQNRELKKALIEARRENTDSINRMHRSNNNISLLLSKFQTIPSPQQVIVQQGFAGVRTKLTARKSTSPMQPSYSVEERSSTPPQTTTVNRLMTMQKPAQPQPVRYQQPVRYVPRLMPKPPTMMTPSNMQQTTRPPQQIRLLKTTNPTTGYRSPLLPIKDPKELGVLECNLYQSQYFAHVKRSTFSLICDIEVVKPPQMLEAVLKTLLHDSLLRSFTLNENYIPGQTLTWKSFPMVQELYAAIVNMISIRKFNKKVCPKSLKEFLQKLVIKNMNQMKPSVQATVTITRTDSSQPSQTFVRMASTPPPGGVTFRATSPKSADISNHSNDTSTTKSNENSNDASGPKIDEMETIDDDNAVQGNGEVEDYDEFEEEMFVFEDEEH